MPEAVVVGAGPNGLVAANVLADAGWDVLVLERSGQPGGAVKSDEAVAPGYVSDTFSAFYPLAVASSAMRSLRLEEHGLVWARAPAALAHPYADGRAAVIFRDPEQTAASLDTFHAGDGDAWLRLFALWQRIGDDLLRAVLGPFPPVGAGVGLLRKLGVHGVLRLIRFMTLPARRVGEEEFGGEGGRLLLAGNALHTDLPPEDAAGAVFGWLLCMLAQDVGFPVPQGGAGQLTAALVRRLESRGGRIECDAEVAEVVVRNGRAVAVRTTDGSQVDAKRAVLADVVATKLYGGLVGWEHLPSSLRQDMRRFHWDYPTFKVDWALREPVPWTAADVGSAGTVHIGDDVDDLTRQFAQLSMSELPDRPFLVVGQMTTADPTRSPRGTESMWAYAHVPHVIRRDAGGDDIAGDWDERAATAFADRIERRIEQYAPGFRARIDTRRTLTPRDLELMNANLVGGAINGGTSSIHQQLVFRPTPSLRRWATPVRGLYLASSSAHPGGGVHGACGANAARTALRNERLRLRG